MALALIIGVGPGLSTSLARALHKRGYALMLAERDTSNISQLADETGAQLVTCDSTKRADMERLFEAVDAAGSPVEVAVYNPSGRTRGQITDIDPVKLEADLMVTAYGAFLMAQHATKRMLAQDSGGALLFTGASAGVKGFANSASFAMGKFALRGLCQSLARELHPQGIHIGHFVIDGAIGEPAQDRPDSTDDSRLAPDAIAKTYMSFLDQHRSAWSWEIELRPWTETF